ncbi:31509_t:CDS:2 [Gigaspora margarita]|uniref:31509_t:CDS:1 n=1 Tax=Gigaspora margarita TaxID=4874 RepID=A0ABN7UX19_GIGMA|nr:31509_t:CDS:2 [Gigaspora margarita]
MSTKNPKESIVEFEEDGEIKELYLATNPYGNFVVEFELLLSELSEFNESKLRKYKFRMFNVDKLEKDDYSNLKASKALSYRKLSGIGTSKTFEFTTTQSDLISSENKLNWSVAVSNRLFKKKAHKSTARLLAISCISKDDMTYKDPKKPKDPNDTSGFTIVFFIDQEDYSIKKILTLNNCGGKVKLFSKYKVPAKADNNSQNMDKKNIDEDNQNTDIKKTSENQTLDKFFLIIFNAYGIHKYHFKHLNINVTTAKIRSFKYPKRIYNALNKNKKFGPEFNQKYIQKCLNLHYFLVDTTDEGAQYMELYDIRTNQLVNTFKRQNLNSLNLIADIPDCVAISHNNKLLAYASGNYVKLYSIDCGLEIASIEIIKNVKESVADYYDDYFMHFFNDDENLLIYQSINQWATWNIFGLEQKLIELKDHHLEFDLKMSNIFSNDNCYHLERANSIIIIVKNKEVNKETKFSNEKYIYDGFISDYLKIENVNPNFKTLSPTESFAEKTIEKEKYFIFDLEHKKSELDDYYHIFEPWLYNSDVKGTPRYSVYLDKKNETLLLIGNHTIQVWHDRAKKDQAKQDPDKHRTLEFISVIDKEENNNISIEKIEYTIRKFKISFNDSKDEIEMGCDDDIIHTVIEACVRYDLLGILIEAKEKQLIRHILFNEKKYIDSPEDSIRKTLDYLVYKLEKNEHSNDKMSDYGHLLHEKSIHMPQYSSWVGKDDTIHRAYKRYLLEYYSNKAVEDIGWMISVGEILPILYNKSRKNGLDIPYFDFLTIPPSISNSLEVFIPITQLIPLDSDLKVEEISIEKIPDVQMVPFVDFATNNKTFMKLKGNKFTNFLKSLIFPNKFLPLELITIPILSIIEKVESDYNDPFYFNPSIEAIMNFMWHASQSHWRNTLYIFIIYFLSYSIITWMYVAHMEVTGDLQHILMFKYFKDPFNYVDLFSLILPFIISVYILIEYYTIEDGFKYAETYIGLSESPTTSEVMNGSTIIYNMTGEAPENLFSNPFTAIISAYNWDSIALNTWGFWPLAIINLLGNIVFIILLQNVIISFMSAAFESAEKRTVLYYQSRLINEYAHLEDSAFTSGRSYFDKQLKHKLKVKYVCFYDNPSITEAWKDESIRWKSIPIYWNVERQIATEDDCKFFIEHEDIRFIWIKKK